MIFEKDFEIRSKKDLIENYFEKDVIKKIWLKSYGFKKIWLKRYDLKTILKDLILKITWLSRKRYDPNIKPFSTEKATYLICWIKSLIDSKYLWKKERNWFWKRFDWKDMIWKRFDFEKFWKPEKICIENKIFPLVPSWR